MAFQQKSERYEHAILDCSDMTLTEYGRDSVRTYSIEEILKRWSGVPDIIFTIERRIELPPTEER